jgi:hypothetical protein
MNEDSQRDKILTLWRLDSYTVETPLQPQNLGLESALREKSKNGSTKDLVWISSATDTNDFQRSLLNRSTGRQAVDVGSVTGIQLLKDIPVPAFEVEGRSMRVGCNRAIFS